MKKNVAKNIFVWSMIILFVFSSGIFLAQMYLDLQDTKSASADVNTIPSFDSYIDGVSSIGACPGDNNYYTQYSTYVSMFNSGVDNSNLLFSYYYRSFNKIYSNNRVEQYFLSTSNSSNVAFNFSLNYYNLSDSPLSLISTGNVYAWYSSGSLSTPSYSASTGKHSDGGMYYFFTSVNNGALGQLNGITFGCFNVFSDSSLNNFDDVFPYTNMSQFSDYISSNFSVGTYSVISLFDSSFNRITLFVQTSTSVNLFVDGYSVKEMYFNYDYNSDMQIIYDKGYQKGYDLGKSVGYQEGLLSDNDYSFLGLLGAVVDAPIAAFTGLFNFELLGINLKDFLAGLFTICIVIVVVRLILVK